MDDYAEEDKFQGREQVVADGSKATFTKPTLEGATFTGTDSFLVEDYIHGGNNEQLKKEYIKTGRSW